VWPGGAERLDLGIASMKRVLADDAARFGSAVGSVHWLMQALLHPALPDSTRPCLLAVVELASLVGAGRITAQPPNCLDDDRSAGSAV
jgi:hypothetical protein